MKKLSLLFVSLLCTMSMSALPTYDLQGGTMAAGVPTDNNALAALFTSDFHTYTGSNRTGEISNVVYGNGPALIRMMKDANSGWKWLGDYIINVKNPDNWGVSEAAWRAAVHAFFNASSNYSLYTNQGLMLLEILVK